MVSREGRRRRFHSQRYPCVPRHSSFLCLVSLFISGPEAGMSLSPTLLSGFEPIETYIVPELEHDFLPCDRVENSGTAPIQKDYVSAAA